MRKCTAIVVSVALVGAMIIAPTQARADIGIGGLPGFPGGGSSSGSGGSSGGKGGGGGSSAGAAAAAFGICMGVSTLIDASRMPKKKGRFGKALGRNLPPCTAATIAGMAHPIAGVVVYFIMKGGFKRLRKGVERKHKSSPEGEWDPFNNDIG